MKTGRINRPGMRGRPGGDGATVRLAAPRSDGYTRFNCSKKRGKTL
ncbi:MAG: hypothetical protein A4E57_02592 [Syntrophorhabdaceae bacterium PtaU1.Bin034]|nr:MAG: hypothetical protein A4E57_02592 [Syntrophorhabdaceae bacterium PtaU1.Bin034]